MQPPLQDVSSPSPRVFHYSLDWRFLLPMAAADDLVVVFDGEREFAETLERVGIPAANQLSFSELKLQQKKDIQSLALPFGLPLGQTGPSDSEQVTFFASARPCLAPGGHLLVGFNHRWNLRDGRGSVYHASTPGRVTSQLRRAGFQSVNVYGVLQNLAIPEYIFELDSRAIEFALESRFRRKPAILRAMRLLVAMLGMARLSGFLPCYFAVALAGPEPG